MHVTVIYEGQRWTVVGDASHTGRLNIRRAGVSKWVDVEACR